MACSSQQYFLADSFRGGFQTSNTAWLQAVQFFFIERIVFRIVKKFSTFYRARQRQIHNKECEKK